MPSIFIGNVNNEHMIRDAELATPEEVRIPAEAARRLLWFAEDGDVLVLPAGPTPAFLAHVSEVTGLDPASVQVVSAADRDGPRALLWELLTSRDIVTALRTLTKHGEWRMHAYYADRTVAWLADRLGVALPRHEFLREGGVDLFNSKAAFRRLMAGTGVPLARGGVVSSAGMLAELAGDLLDSTPSVIVKQDYNCAAHGNVVLTRDPGTDFAGAWERIVIPDRDAVAEVVTSLWPRLVPGGYGDLVVEQYHAGSVSLYVEVEVTDGEPELLGWGRQRMAPHWVGFEIAPAMLAPAPRRLLLDLAVTLGRRARDLGYRGPMSVDAIHTPDGELVLNEQNGRVSGCTHIHHLLRRYAGRPESELVVLTRNWVPSGQLTEVTARLRADGLAWRPGGTGALILADDPLAPGNVEFMVVGTTEEEARELERRALAAIASSVPDHSDAALVAG